MCIGLTNIVPFYKLQFIDPSPLVASPRLMSITSHPYRRAARLYAPTVTMTNLLVWWRVGWERRITTQLSWTNIWKFSAAIWDCCNREIHICQVHGNSLSQANWIKNHQLYQDRLHIAWGVPKEYNLKPMCRIKTCWPRGRTCYITKTNRPRQLTWRQEKTNPARHLRIP